MAFLHMLVMFDTSDQPLLLIQNMILFLRSIDVHFFLVEGGRGGNKTSLLDENLDQLTQNTFKSNFNYTCNISMCQMSHLKCMAFFTILYVFAHKELFIHLFEVCYFILRLCSTEYHFLQSDKYSIKYHRHISGHIQTFYIIDIPGILTQLHISPASCVLFIEY